MEVSKKKVKKTKDLPINQKLGKVKRKLADIPDNNISSLPIKKKKKEKSNKSELSALSTDSHIKNEKSKMKKLIKGIKTKIIRQQDSASSSDVGAIICKTDTAKSEKKKKKKPNKRSQKNGSPESASEVANAFPRNNTSAPNKKKTKKIQHSESDPSVRDSKAMAGGLNKKKKKAPKRVGKELRLSSEDPEKKKKTMIKASPEKPSQVNQQPSNDGGEAKITNLADKILAKKKKLKKKTEKVGTFAISDSPQKIKRKKKSFNVSATQPQELENSLPTDESSPGKKRKARHSSNISGGDSEKIDGPGHRKGKVLRRKIADLKKTLAILYENEKQQSLLLKKTKNDAKSQKIKAKLSKIQEKIKKFKSELKELPMISPAVSATSKVPGKKVKGSPPVQIHGKQFKGLPPVEVPAAKKKDKPVPLKVFLQKQLKSSRFRWLNENLYSSSSGDAQEFFKEDPESFKAYHEGYAEQVSKWPMNPLDTIIKNLKSLPKSSVVADLGCGEAKLAASLPKLKVHSLDFVALKPEVTACDMAHCPLLRSSVDVVVFCLSLMGTNVSDFLLEANRILKTGGTMEIAEVESRFDNIDDFIKDVTKYGFSLTKKDLSDMFFFLTFKKTEDVNKSPKLPEFNLKPCLYKKR